MNEGSVPDGPERRSTWPTRNSQVGYGVHTIHKHPRGVGNLRVFSSIVPVFAFDYARFGPKTAWSNQNGDWDCTMAQVQSRRM